MFKRLSGWVKWLLFVAWFLLLLFVGALLAQQNHQLVQLNLLAWDLPEASAGVVFACTLLVGVACGLLAFLPGFLYVKLKLRRAQRQLNQLQAEAVAVTPKVE